ncbi:MAG: YIP1 family protein [candidate division WOR-3 bacterium]|nr:YIP1 family protein [candidate division WOR-3 bacterium]MDW8151168.1 YIP1 family protein [candidate division WOR-3 bacterium]
MVKIFEVIINPSKFNEIANKNYILVGVLTFIVLTTTFNSLKYVINYENYKITMMNQMDESLKNIEENLKKKGLTLEERKEKLKNYEKFYLQTISLPAIVITYIAIGIFLQPIILLIQTFVFGFIFLLFQNYKYNFKALFSVVLFSKSYIILGSFFTLILSIIFGSPTFSLSASSLIPYEAIANNDYLKILRNTLYHIEPFSILSLILLAIGLSKVFDFQMKQAFLGVFSIFFTFLVLNALFYLLFF